jgi:proprotein convertase subtilisin/kexin type 5
MVCENCRSPCLTCTWSDLCDSCISGFSLSGSSCLSSCPSGQYSDGFKCNQCPSLCTSCSFLNNLPACLTCSTNTFSYSFSCVGSCPNSTTLTDNICYSSDCSNLPNCLSCSGTRCLQCTALYQMDNNFVCSESITSSAVLAGILEMPVPFPFLIGIILLLVISFLLKNNFPKMFSPLFIYSIAGCL